MLLFDGDCAFCSTSARLLQRWVRPDCIVLPYQRVDLQRWHVDPRRAAAEVLFVRRIDEVVVVHGGADAIAEVLRTARAPWPALGSVLQAPLVMPAASALYRWVAANRHRLPGGTPACAMDNGTADAAV